MSERQQNLQRFTIPLGLSLSALNRRVDMKLPVADVVGEEGLDEQRLGGRK